MAVALGVIILLLLWLRRPDSLLNAQFWAEDGTVFFTDQLVHGFWHSLIRPYFGYLHAVPRAVAALVSFLPVRLAPLGFNFSSLLLEAVSCSAFFWPCYRRIIPSDALRAACCLAATTTFMGGSELIATICNVQWFLSLLSLLLLLVGGQEATKKGVEIFLTIVQSLIALSAPATLLYVPFLLWQSKHNPPGRRFRPLIHLAALFFQGLVLTVANNGPKPVLRFNSIFVAVLGSGLSRCVLAPMIGATFLTKDGVIALFTKLLIALIAGVLLATVLAWKLRGTQAMKWLLGAAYVGVGSLVAVLSGRGVAKSFLYLEGLERYTAERYFFLAACLFIFCLALTIDTFASSKKPALAVVVFVCCFALGAVRNFSAKTFDDLNWNASAAKIEAWKMARLRQENVEPLSVPVNPQHWHILLDPKDR